MEKDEVDEVWGVIKNLGRRLDAYLKRETLQSKLHKWIKRGVPVKHAKTGQYTFSMLNKMENNLY